MPPFPPTKKISELHYEKKVRVCFFNLISWHGAVGKLENDRSVRLYIRGGGGYGWSKLIVGALFGPSCTGCGVGIPLGRGEERTCSQLFMRWLYAGLLFWSLIVRFGIVAVFSSSCVFLFVPKKTGGSAYPSLSIQTDVTCTNGEAQVSCLKVVGTCRRAQLLTVGTWKK